MNGHRHRGDQDDSAHGSDYMREPLLQPEAGNPKKGVTEEAPPKHFIARKWRPWKEYFANHPPTVGYMLFLSLVFGVSSGVVAFIYDTYFEAILKLVWEVCLTSRLIVQAIEGAIVMHFEPSQSSPSKFLNCCSKVLCKLQAASCMFTLRTHNRLRTVQRLL